MRSAYLAAIVLANFIDLVQLTGPDGQKVFVNPMEITTLRVLSKLAVVSEHFPKGSHCVIVTTNGKFLPVQETCERVAALVEKAK